MLRNLPKRKRQTVLTAMLSTGFLGLAAGLVLITSPTTEPYAPGEQADGITKDLARSLPDSYSPIRFTDVTLQSGIDFRHFSGSRSSQLPEDMGSGAAWGDYNNDGWPDLFVANIAGPLSLTADELAGSNAYCRLYRNNGDGTFSDMSTPAGVDYRGWANGAAWGDYDDDGDLDLVLTTYGEIVLYRNQGDGTFADASSATGVAGYHGFWAGASWADYNLDGRLDFYVTGYVRYEKPEHVTQSLQYDIENPASINPSSFEPERNLLFRNVDGSAFDEVALPAGVSNPDGRSLSAAWIDLDEDGWQDLYVANDVSDNVLYRNRGDGTFEDVSHEAWVADYRGAMGIAVGDWDGDTDADMVVTHWIAQENALYNNRLAQERGPGGPLRFVDEADRYGLGQISLDYVGWGSAFVDVDNDGRLDLFVVNGSTLQRNDRPEQLGAMRSQLFWNGGPDRGFFDVSSVSGGYFDEQHVGRGAAYADYDRDGDVDLFIVNHGEPGVLLRNDDGNRRSWLAVRIQGRRSNPQGVGARLRLVVGDLVQVRWIGSQPSYASQNDLTEHFGLNGLMRADTLEIVWPSGIRQIHTDMPAGQMIHMIEHVPPS